MDTLPSSQPKRRKPRALRYTTLFVSISALGATCWITRPPELVWYTSPPLGEAHYRLQVLVPNGWEPVNVSTAVVTHGKQKTAFCSLVPMDRRPRFLSRLFPNGEGNCDLALAIHSGPG